MLQGLRSRRQRRLSGWGGGEAPGMRNIINPLDSQDMADRAQGVDISSAMPSTRLETRISEPMAESFVTSQLPQPAATSTVASPEAQLPQPERRGPFMTAAGSNARPDPVSSSQCGPGGCGVGPSQGLDAARYGITLEPGQTLLSVGPEVSRSAGVPAQAMPSSPQPMGQAAPQQQAAGLPAGQAAPASDFDAWGDLLSRGAANPRSVDWLAAAQAAKAKADSFNKLRDTNPDLRWKVFYGNQGAYWDREAFSAVKAHVLAQNLGPRQQMAERAMNKGSIQSQYEDADRFLTTPNMSIRPDDRAAALARLANPKMTPEEIEASPAYAHYRRIAHAGEIAHGAALAAASEESGYPWGTDESRAENASSAWSAARNYYGSMSIDQAAAEIESHFKPAYLKALVERNESLPPDQRRDEGQLRNDAQVHSQALYSELAYEKDPNLGQEAPAMEQPTPQQPPAPPQPAPQRPTAGGTGGFFGHSPSLWGG
jgi:hypothetical protein